MSYREENGQVVLTPATPTQAQQAIRIRSRYEKDRMALEQFQRDMLQAVDDDVMLENLARDGEK
jgi:transcriptional regulator GlxA family with amidase domain